MTPFEQELKRALARREPSDGFTARVLAQTSQREQAIREAGSDHRADVGTWFGSIFAFRRFAALAVVALVLAAGVFYQHRAEQRRGEAAKRQLMTALQIAGAQLHEARLRVKKIEFPEVVMQ